MAKQILAPYTTTAVNLHALIFNGDGQVWNGSVFVPYATADLATYVVPLTEKGTASRIYAVDFPTLITTGVYSWAAYRRAGGSPAEGDPLIGTGQIEWDGSTFTAISSRATQTSVDDLPTNAELATALGTADDAVLAAIAALNNLSSAGAQSAAAAALTAYGAALQTTALAVKAKTDQLVFTKTNELDINLQSINGTTVIGDGAVTPWGP